MGEKLVSGINQFIITYRLSAALPILIDFLTRLPRGVTVGDMTTGDSDRFDVRRGSVDKTITMSNTAVGTTRVQCYEEPIPV